MNINKNIILDKTNYGLSIYSHILREYRPGETVLSLSGHVCKPVKNPFTLSKIKSLNIKCINRLFMFEDTENPEFKGDPFDFAELHYKISGDNLLKKLNDDLYLRLDKGYSFYGNTLIKPQFEPMIEMPTLEDLLRIPEFSFFRRPVSNTTPNKVIDLIEVYKLIKGFTYQSVTEKLRGMDDKAEARKFKAANFDYVTFSGTFIKRENNSLLMHSGLITIDFDHVKDLNRLRSALLKDDYFETELLFVSPSGDGLKWIVSIDINEYSHADYFEGIQGYIAKTYSLEIDRSGRDVARACFLGYDSNIFIHPKYQRYVC